MSDFVIARVIHVLAVVLWVGGVGFVTLCLLPVVRKDVDASGQLAAFERFERAFAWQSRIWTTLAAISGFYMLQALDAWDRYLKPAYWWLHLMTFVWMLFAFMLFIAEPLFLAKRLRRWAAADPGGTLAGIQALHVALLVLSLLAVLGAVGGSHGWF